jgi:hypothetical protein
MINFAYDDDGRRTDTWFASDASNYGWAAHTHVDNDNSGRGVPRGFRTPDPIGSGPEWRGSSAGTAKEVHA